MKLKFLILFMFMFAASGCSMKSHTSRDVLIEIEKQGLDVAYISDSPFEEWQLRGIEPEMISVQSQKVKFELPEVIGVYIFKSEEERAEGRKEFDDKMAMLNMNIIPKLYEGNNALLIYWSNVKLGQQPVYDDQITNAIENLNK